MKLWILKPIYRKEQSPWDPWYDKAFGFVVCAATEQGAREFASDRCSDEKPEAWTNSYHSTCEELKPENEEPGVILCDFHSA